MCGIVGYIGEKKSLPILIDGLKRLEYRGYDSAGVAIFDNEKIVMVKTAGKIKNLEKELDKHDINGRIGIAHTRWATHGAPTKTNAHPHFCGKVFLVHNGIVENYQKLKENLIAKGHRFASATDTEVIAHLIDEFYEGNLKDAVQKSLAVISGAYGLVVMHENEPDKLIAAKLGSPLTIGVGDKEMIIASDAAAIINRTRKIINLEDGEIAEITKHKCQICDRGNNAVQRGAQTIKWNADNISKNGFSHFMLKEIFEQGEAVKNSLRGRIIGNQVKLGGMDNIKNKLKKTERIIIIACGTAYYAGLVGGYMIEEYAGIPVKVEQASEFRYRQPVIDNKTLVIVISQSGETADTLAAINEAKKRGAATVGIVNAVGSAIARQVDAGIYNHIGPEIAVASTKAFMSQLVILSLLTVWLGQYRNMPSKISKEIIAGIKRLPAKIELVLKQNTEIKKLAKKYFQARHFGFLGRKYNFPIALEGALKLKEISYIHAEGFPSGELKHGPIALINNNFPCLCLAPRDSVYEKNISNMQEIKSRGGRIIAVATEGDREIKSVADDVIYIPKILEMLNPVLSVIPLQLFAYYMAVLNKRDVDQPRNLAKSVTVE